MSVRIPFQVGLTGGIGSGKSVVARLFSLYGVPVYESDTEAKKLYLEPEIRKEVVQLLGPESYSAELKPDTAWIAKAIYADPSKREKLNAILHPAVAKSYKRWLEEQTHPYILKVAALIFEADIAKDMDYLVLVVSPEKLREERVILRDASRPREQIRKILNSQWTDEQKIPLSDVLIRNDEHHSLIRQVDELNTLLLQKASASPNPLNH
jgi:dephospho-CoA kinase